MFSDDWTSKSKAFLAALPILAAATSVALNIVVLAFVIQLEAKIDIAHMSDMTQGLRGCAIERPDTHAVITVLLNLGN